jgi:hypothetical protein
MFGRSLRSAPQFFGVRAACSSRPPNFPRSSFPLGARYSPPSRLRYSPGAKLRHQSRQCHNVGPLHLAHHPSCAGDEGGAADLACIAYLGIVQIGCAYLLFTLAMAWGIRSLDAGIIGYAEPVLSPVSVFLFIGERPSGWAIVGGAIIIASVIVHMQISAQEKRWKAVALR